MDIRTPRPTFFLEILQNYPQCLSWMAYDGFEAYNWQVNTWIPVAGLGGIGWVFVVAR